MDQDDEAAEARRVAELEEKFARMDREVHPPRSDNQGGPNGSSTE